MSDRIQAMVASLGDPERIDRDGSGAPRIDIHVFRRNFVEECADEPDDEGYVLVTSGMSDQLMTPTQGFDHDETLALELIWYVRELNPEYFSNLRWLAKLPFIDRTWFGHGHTIPMPAPPLSFCAFSTFLLLPPIVRSDRHLFVGIQQQRQPIGTLAVHLVSASEYALIQREDGLNQFLDLLDDHGYPVIHDPARKPYVADAL